MSSDSDPPRVDWGPREVEAFARLVQEELAWLVPKLPEVDPGDMVHILGQLHRPFGTGIKFFLKPLPGGGYVF